MNLQIHQEAADWFVEFRTGEPDAATRKAFDAWVRHSPEHLRAYIETAEIWQDLPHIRSDSVAVASALVDEASTGNVIALRDAPPSHTSKATPLPRSVRVRSLAIAASALLLIVSGVFLWLFTQQDVYATGIGEERTIALPDGSTVQLNSRTKLRVSFHREERDVDLLRGQALFRVAKDANRPFVVHSEGTQVRAVGTEFDVYRKVGETIVTVVEGHVAVTPDALRTASASTPIQISGSAAPLATTEVSLAAGEQLTVSNAAPPRPKSVDATAATAWTQHKIVFKSSPLRAVFEELNRYSKRPLRLQGAGLEDFLISGTYATADPALLVRFLRDQPGIMVEETTDAIIVSKKK